MAYDPPRAASGGPERYLRLMIFETMQICRLVHDMTLTK